MGTTACKCSDGKRDPLEDLNGDAPVAVVDDATPLFEAVSSDKVKSKEAVKEENEENEKPTEAGEEESQAALDEIPAKEADTVDVKSREDSEKGNGADKEEVPANEDNGEVEGGKVATRNSHEVTHPEAAESEPKHPRRQALRRFTENVLKTMGRANPEEHALSGEGTSLVLLDPDTAMRPIEEALKNHDFGSAYDGFTLLRFESVGGDLSSANPEEVHAHLQAWFLEASTEYVMEAINHRPFGTLNTVADLLLRKANDYSRARTLLQVTIRDSEKESAEHNQAAQLLATCFVHLTNTGVAQMENGEFQLAKTSFEDARVTMDSIGNDETKEYAQLLINLAIVSGMLDDKSRQTALYDEARQVYEKIGATDHPKYQEVLAHLKKSEGGKRRCCELQ